MYEGCPPEGLAKHWTTFFLLFLLFAKLYIFCCFAVVRILICFNPPQANGLHRARWFCICSGAGCILVAHTKICSAASFPNKNRSLPNKTDHPLTKTYRSRTGSDYFRTDTSFPNKNKSLPDQNIIAMSKQKTITS